MTQTYESQIDELCPAVGEALGVDAVAVRRILSAYLAGGDDARVDPRYLAGYHASEDPPLAPELVPRIVSSFNLLRGLPRYRDAEVQKFIDGIDRTPRMPAADPDAELWDSDEAFRVDEVGEEDAAARAREQRAEWAQGYAERLEAARTRRDLDDVLTEMRSAWAVDQRLSSMPEGMRRIVEALWSFGQASESLREMALRVAPEACEELGGPAGVLQEASGLAGERWACSTALRKKIRELLVSEGVLAVRPSRGRPDVVIPGALASVRKPVPELSPREVRDLQQRTEEAGCTLRIEIDPGRAMEVVADLEDGGAEARCYPLAVRDAMTRTLGELLLPELGRELKTRLLARANRREVEAVGEAYLNRLDALPLDEDELLAIDPGYAHGCRLVTIRRDGSLVDHGSYELIGAGIDPAQTITTLRTLFADTEAHVVAIAVGEGHQELYSRVREAVRVETASPREGEEWDEDAEEEGEEGEEEATSMDTFLVDGLALDAAAGAPPLKGNYPEADARLRRCVVTGRRLLDPFGAWSEVDPRAIASAYEWTGLDASALAKQLDEVLRGELCWRGVNVNTAAEPLLARIPGVERSGASELVRRRREQGGFRSRDEIRDSGLIPAGAWEQCAGFLLVEDEAADPLDACPVHPRDYELARAILGRLDAPLPRVRERARLSGRLPKVDAAQIAEELGVGPARVNDLLQKLAGTSHRPVADRDPAEDIAGLPDEVFDDLISGMEVRGTVGDIVTYGAFVDIGTSSPALLHISELAERYVPDPRLIVRTGDEIVARVLSVEEGGERVALSLRRDHRAGRAASEPHRPIVRPARPTNATRKLVRTGTARYPTASDEADRYPEVGDVIRGQVQRVVDYGAFIEFGLRRAGLLHRTQMTTDAQADPRELLQSGDTVICRVIESNPQVERIGLSILDLPPSTPVTYDPEPGWEDRVRPDPARADLRRGATQRHSYTGTDTGTRRPVAGGSRRYSRDDLPTARFEGAAGARGRQPELRNLAYPDSRSDHPATFEDVQPDMVVHGKVTKTVSYGIFVDLGIDAPALIHISEIADEFVRDPGSLVDQGEMLRAHVLRVDRENRCVALTLRRDDAGRLI